MKRFFLLLLVLTSGLFAAQKGNAVVIDTIVADGYYRICSNYYIDGKMPPNPIPGKPGGYVYPGDLVTASSTYKGFNGIYIGPVDGVSEDDLKYIWHVWRDKETGEYHIKNCWGEADTYMFPVRSIAGQADYIFMTGREQETYRFQTASMGSGTSASDPWKCKLDRQDKPVNPTAKHISAAPDYEYQTADKMFFIQPSSNIWRWRIGGSSLVKLNSCSGREGASWWFEPVDLTGREAWMRLNEAITDAKGEHFTFGNNPGQIADKAVYSKFESQLEDALDLLDFGGSDAEYDEMAAKVKEAVAVASKECVQLDGYFYLKNHYDSYGEGVHKYATWFNDDSKRPYATSGTKSYDVYADDTSRIFVRSHRWMPQHYWFGYWYGIGTDHDGVDAQSSGLEDKFIWHITPNGDGTYKTKNCAESAVCGDTTYYITNIKRTALGAAAWCQMAMTGTPQQSQIYTKVSGNEYWIYQSDNFYPLNMGNHYFNTQNPTNSMTYGLWEFYTVNPERITSKFKLNEAITDAGGVFNDWAVGDWPGMIKESYVADLRAALADARDVYANATSDADMDAAAAKLKSIYEATMATLKDTDKVLNPIVEGYYRINNVDYMPAFNAKWKYLTGIMTSAHATDKQSFWWPRDGVSVDVNGNTWEIEDLLDPYYDIYAGTDNIVRWDWSDMKKKNEEGEWVDNPDFRALDIYRTWKIEKGSTPGTWAIKNLGTGKYMQAATSGSVYLEEEPSDIYISDNLQYTPLYSTYYYPNLNLFRTRGWFSLDVFNASGVPNHITPNGNTSTSGDPNTTDGNTCVFSTNFYDYMYYQLQPIEGASLDSLLEIGNAAARLQAADEYINKAKNAMDNAFHYDIDTAKPLVTSTGTEVDEDGLIVSYDPEKNQFNTPMKNWYSTTNDAEEYWTGRKVGGAYQALIDGDPATWFHGRWSATYGPNISEDEYLQINMIEPQTAVRFMYTLRGNADEKYGNYGGRPITYGATDNGQDNRTIEFSVYASNDSTLPTDQWTAVRKNVKLYNDQNIRTMYTPAIVMDQPYQFVRYQINRTKNSNLFSGHPYWNCGEFNVFTATLNEANSPYYYDSNVKDAVDYLQKTVTALAAEKEAGVVNQATLDAINEGVARMAEVCPDTFALLSAIYAAQALADSIYTEDNVAEQQYGDVTAAQKQVLVDAIAAAKALVAESAHTSVADLAAAIETLNGVAEEVNSQRKTFETDKWYYIVSTEYQGYTCRWNWAWRGNQLVYACGDIPQAPLGKNVMANIASPVRWGKYKDFADCPEGHYKPVNYSAATYGGDKGYVDYTGGDWEGKNSPYTQWRIVQLTDTTYAIQNRANGLYLGRRQDYTNGTYNYVTLSKEPMPVEIALLGRDQYEILPADSTCGYYSVQADKVIAATGKMPTPAIEKGLPFHSQGSDFHMVWWGTGTERGYNTGSAYTFKAIDDEEDFIEYPATENNIEIVSLPYAADFSDGWLVESASGEAYSYGIKNVIVEGEDSTTVELVEKDVFEAGEPFVLVTGAPEDYVGDAADSIFYYVDPLMCGTDYTLDAVNVNGLVSSLSGDTLTAAGYGFFADAVLKVTDGEKKVYIKGHSGYVDPKTTTDLGGSADLVVGGKGVIDAIKNIVATKNDDIVDVYSVDGKLVKTGVKRSAAKAGLSKGIYMIGKKKVYVK